MPNRTDPDVPGRGQRQGVPAPLGDLPWELPHRFLGLDDDAAAFETAGAVVLPVPYEATTSWGGGTRNGPRAILEASRYLELYDQELDADPSVVGVHTLPALELTRAGPEAAMVELAGAYARVLEVAGDRFVIMLGGEHSITAPAVLAHADRDPDERLTVLQLDAHADLRPTYEGTPASHASAMARVIDRVDLVTVGVRAASTEEVEVARRRAAGGSGEGRGVTLVWADEMWADDAWMERALEALGPRVYLTFDVDYLDPSLMPSTGTPEPGGGDWYRTLRFLRRVFREREVVGAD
ncbi:MAG: agmatinase, partial [Gemmatimonadota bacterium]